MKTLGWSYNEIENSFFLQTGTRLCNQQSITRSLRATALGYHWDPRCTGGRPSYLCKYDESSLVQIIRDSASELESTPKWMIQNLAHEMKIDRINFAINYLHKFNIDVLTLLGHCSHVLQPFDVGIAAPLKAALRKQIQKTEVKIREGFFHGWSQAGVKRYTLVSSFLEGFHKAVTPMNARSSFEATGNFPLNLQRVLENRYVTTPQYAQCEEEWQNSMYIASRENLRSTARRLNRLVNGVIINLKDAAAMIASSTLGELLTEVERNC